MAIAQKAVTSVENGDVVILDGKLAKVVGVNVAEAVNDHHILGLDLFTNQHVAEYFPGDASVIVPAIQKTVYKLTAINGDTAELSNVESGVGTSLPLPEGEFGNQIKTAFEAAQAENQEYKVTVVEYNATLSISNL